jgi:hypothetical protein
MPAQFKEFLTAFPPDPTELGEVDGSSLVKMIEDHFEVPVPDIIVDFWAEVGCGYFANRELYVFGDDPMSASRDSLIVWNSLDCWARILPRPREGGPLFFAETCFGAQLGFRWDQGAAIGYLLDLDTQEAFRVADDCRALFAEVLVDRYAFTDPALLEGVRRTAGTLPVGMQYAPIVSPLVGGALAPDNYHLETPYVHLCTSIATWEAVKGRTRA